MCKGMAYQPCPEEYKGELSNAYGQNSHEDLFLIKL